MDSVVRCPEEACSICEDGRGGYTFKWYDVKWRGGYLARVRFGYWSPGQEESTRTDDPGLIPDMCFGYCARDPRYM